MGKVALVCPGCQAKYRITIQGEAKDKISFSCKKCGQILEVDPRQAKEEAPTQDLLKATCEKCGAEFVKNPEDDARLCYQCRIDLLVSRKKQEVVESPKAVAPAAEAEKSTARYTFKNPEGLVLGPIKLRTAVVLIREKRITGNEMVSRDGSEFIPLVQYPELAEFFPQLLSNPEPITQTDQIPLEEPEALPAQASEKKTEPATSEPRIYYLRLNQGKLLGPLRKTTVVDLIECGFLCGKDQCSRDQRTWAMLEMDQEFKELLSKEDAEVVELTESVEE